MQITGRGIIEKGRKPNTWYITHYLGEKDEKGRYRRAPRRLVKGKKAEAYKALEDYRRELEEEALGKPEEETVGQYARRFHDERLFSSPLARRREELEVRRIEDLLGQIELSKLTAPQIRSAYASERKKREAGRGGLTENTLYKIHVKLRQILRQAYMDEIIDSNPADRVEVKRPPSAERNSLSIEEAHRLNDLLKKEFKESPDSRVVGLALILMLGCRRGEALGLHWRNVSLDSDEPTIDIVEQYSSDRQLRAPKSKESTRTVWPDKELVKMLRSWKEMQARIFHLDARAQENFPVVTDINGGLCDPDNFKRWFQTFSVRHGFAKWVDDDGNELVERFNEKGFPVDEDGRPYSRGHRRPRRHYEGLKLHELRHTHATILISKGADMKTVQQRLGHAQASTTMDIYAHAVKANDKIAADIIDKALN